jgi:hypothetical protein
MKTFVLLAVSIVLVGIVLVGILFCPTVMAFLSIPDDVQMVQPDPSLPKELSAFFGKWRGISGNQEFFLIVEKIGREWARLYHWRTGGPRRGSPGWHRKKAEVIQDREKYKLRFIGAEGTNELTLRGEYLDWSGPNALSIVLTRVP